MSKDEHPLRQWRQRHGLSLRRVSALLMEEGYAVSHASLARMERGVQDPPFDLLLYLLQLSNGELTLDLWVPPALAARVYGNRSKSDARRILGPAALADGPAHSRKQARRLYGGR